VIDNEQISPFPTELSEQSILSPISPVSTRSKQSPSNSYNQEVGKGRPQMNSYTFQDDVVPPKMKRSPVRSYHDEFYNKSSSFRAILETFSNESEDTERVSNVSANTGTNSDFKTRLKSGLYAKRGRTPKHSFPPTSRLEKTNKDEKVNDENTSYGNDKKLRKENLVTLKSFESKSHRYEGSCAGQLLSMMDGVCGLGISSTTTKDDFDVEFCGKVQKSKSSSEEDLSVKKKRNKKKRVEQPRSISRNSTMTERGRTRYREGALHV